MEASTEEYFHRHRVSLRISGEIETFTTISDFVGLTPSNVWSQGDSFSECDHSNVAQEDIWLLNVPGEPTLSLDEHLMTLKNMLGDNVGQIAKLRGYRIYLLCGYRSNCDHGGFDLNPESLQFLSKLQIPVRFSIVIS